MAHSAPASYRIAVISLCHPGAFNAYPFIDRIDTAPPDGAVELPRWQGHETAPGEMSLVDYLTHYYAAGTEPFRSLSALPDAEALRLMAELYIEGSVIWERFKDPAAYLRNRRATEKWVRAEFLAKGGRPREAYPIYMVLGSSGWISRHGDANTAVAHIPISALAECDVSFTYPDSMISRWFGADKPSEYYLEEYHGKVFTLPEILAVVANRGMPEENWDTNLPANLAPYIEAQVWNSAPLKAFSPHVREVSRPGRLLGCHD
jgi:hypothetical protein